ncbi:MAG TPA: hypothetical protein VFW40_05890 [Capsulimonadaceae bacterium]|nr:hypothetical protein [Capsulimonadaceae bacterium]
MKYLFSLIAAASLLGVIAVAGCSHSQPKPTDAPPPEASRQTMQQQAQVRAQQEAGGLAVMQQHMHQTGPPAAAPGPH